MGLMKLSGERKVFKVSESKIPFNLLTSDCWQNFKELSVLKVEQINFLHQKACIVSTYLAGCLYTRNLDLKFKAEQDKY